MSDFVAFLKKNGLEDAESLMAEILLFCDDHELFEKLPKAERDAFERRVDKAWALIAM